MMTEPRAEWFQKAKSWAGAIKRDVFALWIAARDPRVPWLAKLTARCVAAYALSPIDLIPDFIPMFGYLDDFILVPLGLMLAVRLVTERLMAEFGATAADREGRPLKLSCVEHSGASNIGTQTAPAKVPTGRCLLSSNRRDRFSDSDLLREVLEITVKRCMAEGWSEARGLPSMPA